MVKKGIFAFIGILMLAIPACIFTSPTPAPTLPTTAGPGNTPAPTSTLQPVADTAVPSSTATETSATQTATASPSPSNSPNPTPTSTLAPVSVPAATVYIDDRSTASQVIVSFYNAIKRHEYVRAYSYWDDPANSLGSFDPFANGYSDTDSVDLVFGAINGDPGMSQVYYTIPVLLKVTLSNNAHSNYAACYVVHKVNPDVYGAPPVAPMSINSGSAQAANSNASDSSLLDMACSGYPTGGNPPISAHSNSLNIDKSNFVDNRSGGIETVSSLLNSLNLKQYARAYSYFQNPANFPGAYDSWAAGYADTGVITAAFGTVISEGAAGSLYYKVPLAMIVLTTTNSTQTFVGCYTLHLSQPATQGAPPFQPMGIQSGKFNQVANGTNVNTLLPAACH
jgi:hypothetical protein